MINEIIYTAKPIVKMDENHVNLIYSLVICNKPEKILEIGVGTGVISLKLLEGIKYNQLNSTLTCVDNFCDWGGIPPKEFNNYKENFNFIFSDEKSFINSCNETFDFIVSDADHHHTNEWVDKTFKLLNDGGILIYHDVTNKDFPNLYEIIDYVKNNNIPHMIFNKSSLKNERCERGLLIIKK